MPNRQRGCSRWVPPAGRDTGRQGETGTPLPPGSGDVRLGGFLSSNHERQPHSWAGNSDPSGSCPTRPGVPHLLLSPSSSCPRAACVARTLVAPLRAEELSGSAWPCAAAMCPT